MEEMGRVWELKKVIPLLNREDANKRGLRTLGIHKMKQMKQIKRTRNGQMNQS